MIFFPLEFSIFCSWFNSFPFQGSNLFMGYIGDSRAIMGSKDSSDSMVAVQLTVDLKPDLPSMRDTLFCYCFEHLLILYGFC